MRQPSAIRLLWFARFAALGLVAWGVWSYVARGHARGEPAARIAFGLATLLALWLGYLGLLWGLGFVARRFSGNRTS